MLSLHPYLQSLWAEQRWGLACTGIVPVGGGDQGDGGTIYTVHLTFHWLPQTNRGDDHRTINFGPGADGFQALLDNLRESRQTAPLYGEKNAEYTAAEREAILSIPSGHMIQVTVDSEQDAKKMKAMIDLQWATIRIACLSGSVVTDYSNVDPYDDQGAFGFSYMLA